MVSSASEATGDGDTASDKSGGAKMDSETASGPSGVDGGSGGSGAKLRARIVADSEVELLTRDSQDRRNPQQRTRRTNTVRLPLCYQVALYHVALGTDNAGLQSLIALKTSEQSCDPEQQALIRVSRIYKKCRLCGHQTECSALRNPEDANDPERTASTERPARACSPVRVGLEHQRQSSRSQVGAGKESIAVRDAKVNLPGQERSKTISPLVSENTVTRRVYTGLMMDGVWLSKPIVINSLGTPLCLLHLHSVHHMTLASMKTYLPTQVLSTGRSVVCQRGFQPGFWTGTRSDINQIQHKECCTSCFTSLL